MAITPFEICAVFINAVGVVLFLVLVQFIVTHMRKRNYSYIAIFWTPAAYCCFTVGVIEFFFGQANKSYLIVIKWIWISISVTLILSGIVLELCPPKISPYKTPIHTEVKRLKKDFLANGRTEEII